MPPLWYPPHAFYRETHGIIILSVVSPPKESCADLSAYTIKTFLIPRDSDLFHLAVLRVLQGPDALPVLPHRTPAVVSIDRLSASGFTHEEHVFWSGLLLGYRQRTLPRESENDLREFKELLRKLNLI